MGQLLGAGGGVSMFGCELLRGPAAGQKKGIESFSLSLSYILPCQSPSRTQSQTQRPVFQLNFRSSQTSRKPIGS